MTNHTTPNDIALLREALIRARSDFHLISLHGEMRPMWQDAKAGRDRVQDALDRFDARFDAADKEAGEVPAGMVLVPVEPTEAMLRAYAPHTTEHDRLLRSVWSAMLSAAPATPPQNVDAEVERLRETAQAVLDRMFSTYKARNGREVGIEGDDGEKCWIIHSDDIEALRGALTATPPAAEGEGV